MIIDFHAHIFPPSFRERREECLKQDSTFAALFADPGARISSATALIMAMDEAKIDVAVVMGIGWTDKTLAVEANDYIIQSANRFPDRLIGFCSVNPAWGDDAVHEVERCAKVGIKGIGELHPDTQGYDIGNLKVMEPIMTAARELKMVVLTHASEPVGHLYPGKGKTTPDKLYPFILNFPDNKIVCAHWGGALPLYTLMPEVARSLENVYFDTAASPLLYSEEIISTVVHLNGAERILFGTDFPLLGHRRMVDQIQSARIPEEARVDILGRNAQSLLQIKAR